MISIDVSELRKTIVRRMKYLNTATVEETKTYDLRTFDVVQSFLISNRESRKFGIEYYRDAFGSKKNFFVNQQEKISLLQTKPVLLDFSRQDVDCYIVHSRDPNYIPFRFDMQEDLWSLLDKYTGNYMNKGYIYVQIIFQRAKGWKQDLYDQYNAYLDGIGNPSSNRHILQMQYKLLSFFKDVSKQPYSLPEVTEKLEQTGYHVWQRVMILGDPKTRSKLFEKIKIAYSHMSYANHWQFEQTKDTKMFIENAQMRNLNKHYKNVLCLSEIMPYFGGAAEVPANEKLDIQRPSTLIKTQDAPVEVKQYKGISDSDKQMIEDIEWAFQRVKLLDVGQKLEVVEVREGTTLKFITFMRPDGLKLQKIKESITDMELDLQMNGLTIDQGTVRGSISIGVPKTERTFIQLESIMNDSEFKLFAAKSELPLILGVDMFGNPFFADLVKLVHILIAGTTGSGKSVFLNCLLVALTTLLSPQQLTLYLIDPKQVELTPYSKLPHVPGNGYTTDPKKAKAIYEKVIEIMEQRYEKLAEEGVKNIAQYNKKYPTEKWDYIIVVTDEFADLVMQEPLDDVVVRLGQKARACGIHLIMATQRPERAVVSGLLKSNLPTKISFALSSHVDYQTVFGKMIPFRLLGKGDSAFQTVAYEMPAEFTRFQSAYVDDEDLSKILSKIIDKWGNKKKEIALELEEEPVPEQEEDSIDEKYAELKRIICETGETRLDQLRNLTRMNRTKLHEYVQPLIDEGWLEKGESRRSGYRLLLTEEEREAYLRNTH